MSIPTSDTNESQHFTRHHCVNPGSAGTAPAGMVFCRWGTFEHWNDTTVCVQYVGATPNTYGPGVDPASTPSSGVTCAMPPGFLDGGENGENRDK